MALRTSHQQKIGRVRKPRVHITYNVETGGAIEKKELPMVVGVLADLAGTPATPQPPMNERKFEEIDRDNFDVVMAKIAPRLAFKVKNVMQDKKAGSEIPVELKFTSIEDFEPQRIAEKVESLKGMIEARRKLANMRSSLSGNSKLEALFEQILNDQAELTRFRSTFSKPAQEERS